MLRLILFLLLVLSFS